jgi:DNA modification methylase
VTPYYEDEWVTLYLGDCMEILPHLASGSVDLVLTDPPYNVSEAGADIVHAGTQAVAWVRDFGEWDRSDWHPGALLAQASRLLRPGGALLSFCSDRLLSAYRTAQLAPRGTIVWEKTNPPPTPRPGYVSATEWIVWLQQPGGPATWNAGGAVPNIVRYPIAGGSDRTAHPTQKPLALVSELMQRHSQPGDLVLDPFVGSGTTLRAAKNLGRRAIGIEANPEYCAWGAARLAQAALALGGV